MKHVRSSFFTHTEPNHLIILQHGWLSPWVRATPLANGIARLAASKHSLDENNRYLVHISRANSDYVFGWRRTQDGIQRGGQRTSDEIKSVLDRHPSIGRISLIGQSLGGLYLRYAVKELYDADSGKMHGAEPVNFITLATPHLGTDDWVKHRKMELYKTAQKVGFLPRTLSQMLRLDKDRLIETMASNEEYLEPLRAFKNRLIYANVINDNRVSCSSGLMLPSFDWLDEEELLREMYSEDIRQSQQQRKSVVSAKMQEAMLQLQRRKEAEKVQLSPAETGDGGKTEKQWFDALSESIDWKRFVVTVNSNFVDKKMAHGLVANPVPQYSSCVPIFDHLERHFRW